MMSSVRKRMLITLTIAAFAAGATQNGLAQHEKPTRVEPIYTEFFGPPPSLGEMVRASAAVVRVRLERENPDDRQMPNEPAPRVLTRHVGTVLEVFKDDPDHPLVAAGEIGILREGGKRDRGAYVEHVVQQGFPNLPTGEYVLFLKWHPMYEAWLLAFGPDSAYELRGGIVNGFGPASISRAQTGRSAKEFLSQLRDAALNEGGGGVDQCNHGS